MLQFALIMTYDEAHCTSQWICQILSQFAKICGVFMRFSATLPMMAFVAFPWCPHLHLCLLPALAMHLRPFSCGPSLAALDQSRV